VNNIDVTSTRQLIDTRNQLDRHAYANKVDWHFAHINNRWTKRALASVGFGYRRLAAGWLSSGSLPTAWRISEVPNLALLVQESLRCPTYRSQ
jgi:hypothetical protein